MEKEPKKEIIIKEGFDKVEKCCREFHMEVRRDIAEHCESMKRMFRRAMEKILLGLTEEEYKKLEDRARKKNPPATDV